MTLHQEKAQISATENYILKVNNLSKSFINKKAKNLVLEDLSFNLKKGEFVSILGPNGAGKTTLLGCIANKITPDQGSVIFNGNLKDDLSYIFQKFESSLMRYYTVNRNISFPLEKKNYSQEQRQKKVLDLLNKCDITLPLDSYPYQCSGGQKQLIAVMRGLITEPKILLIDEGFSALDYHIRLSMAETLLNIWEKMKTTIIFVTHQPDEAVLLSQRVLVLSKKPAKLVADIRVDLPSSRTKDIVKTDAFDRIRKKVLDAFYKGMET
jgi:NitT/TauT family transport system ATP-binding protein